MPEFRVEQVKSAALVKHRKRRQAHQGGSQQNGTEREGQLSAPVVDAQVAAIQQALQAGRNDQQRYSDCDRQADPENRSALLSAGLDRCGNGAQEIWKEAVGALLDTEASLGPGKGIDETDAPGWQVDIVNTGNPPLLEVAD